MIYKAVSAKSLIVREAIFGIFGTFIVCALLSFIFRWLGNIFPTLSSVFPLVIVCLTIIGVSSFVVYFIGKINLIKYNSYLSALLGSGLGLGMCLLAVLLTSLTLGFGGQGGGFRSLIWGTFLIIPSIGAVIGFNLKRNT